MESDMDLEQFCHLWPALKKRLPTLPNLLKDKSIEEKVQIIGDLHCQFKILVKFFYANCDLIDTEEKKQFNTFQRKYCTFVHIYQKVYKRYFASLKKETLPLHLSNKCARCNRELDLNALKRMNSWDMECHWFIMRNYYTCDNCKTIFCYSCYHQINSKCTKCEGMTFTCSKYIFCDLLYVDGRVPPPNCLL
jgi:hypothetical protein